MIATYFTDLGNYTVRECTPYPIRGPKRVYGLADMKLREWSHASNRLQSVILHKEHASIVHAVRLDELGRGFSIMVFYRNGCWIISYDMAVCEYVFCGNSNTRAQARASSDDIGAWQQRNV